MLKISQKQYTFIMHLVDEFGLFLDVLERNKVQSRVIKQQLQRESSSSPSTPPSNDMRMTVCLICPTTFTLAVLDGFDDIKIDIPVAALPPSLPEAELEPVMHDSSDANVVVDLIAASAPIVAGTAKIEPPPPSSSSTLVTDEIPPGDNLSKAFHLLGKKKGRIEENIQRGLDIASKASRGSSQSSLVNLSDNGDDTSSQWDQLSEDFDADLDITSFNLDVDLQQQQNAARIELDDDSLSLHEPNASNPMKAGTNALESVSTPDIALQGCHRRSFARADQWCLSQSQPHTDLRDRK